MDPKLHPFFKCKSHPLGRTRMKHTHINGYIGNQGTKQVSTDRPKSLRLNRTGLGLKPHLCRLSVWAVCANCFDFSELQLPPGKMGKIPTLLCFFGFFFKVILFFSNFKIYRKFEMIVWRVVIDSLPGFPYC